MQSESDVMVYSSAAHLAVAMRLVFHGRASLSEMKAYMSRVGVSTTDEEIVNVLEEYKRHQYVADCDGGGYEARRSLAELVARRAPSRKHLESTPRALFI